jgi:hypothetical protein
MKTIHAIISNIKLGGDMQYISDLLKEGGFTIEVLSVHEVQEE